jgi:hypothetical protein
MKWKRKKNPLRAGDLVVFERDAGGYYFGNNDDMAKTHGIVQSVDEFGAMIHIENNWRFPKRETGWTFLPADFNRIHRFPRNLSKRRTSE